MIASTSAEPPGLTDPRYVEGLHHLQRGEWQQAILAFEALIATYGASGPIQEVLDEARYKAGRDAKLRVRARRWIIPWRMILTRAVIVITLGVAVILGAQFINRRIAPMVAQSQVQRERAALRAQAQAYLDANELDRSETAFNALLVQIPDDTEARKALETIAGKRELMAKYDRAVALQAAGQQEEALNLFTEISLLAPATRDVNQRIATINKQLELDRLFTEAEAAFQAGQLLNAVAKFEALQQASVSFRSDLVASRLFGLYTQLGRELVEQDPPAPKLLPQAIEYFAKALALQPRNTEVGQELRLAQSYQQGQADYQLGKWDSAVALLRSVYDQRPDYLGGSMIAPLYEAYIYIGDSAREQGDIGLAWEQYRRAAELPVSDTVLADARLAMVLPLLTPTATPLPTPTPTVYVFVPPSPVPSATPPPPLATFRNQIVFKSANEQKPGFWVMNPDGSNARYLGDSADQQKQYEALIAREKLSPDGRYRAYVQHGEGEDSPQIFIQAFEKDPYGNVETRQVTRFTGLNYDPVWAPDGSRIAYVSTHQGTDDLWVIDPDGTNAWNYTRNKWEWDKHPSWSPDSRKIVFWSNREGTKQIFVIDANGQNLKKIHAVPWDEYDPIWIK